MSKDGLSFKIHRDDEERFSSRKKKRDPEKDFYWNHQVMDKKKRMYEDLKSMFDMDKDTITKKALKKQKL